MMSAPVPDPALRAGEDLDGLLQQQEQLLQALADMLQSELDILMSGRAEGLPDLAARKAELCTRIDALEAQRAGRDGARGAKIRELAQVVANANQRNGVVLTALINNTRGALEVLRAIPGADTARVYGPGGTVGARAAGKPLGSA